jgi:hypothetical protein
MDFNTLLKYIYKEEHIVSKIKSYDETKDIEVQWPRCNLILMDNEIFLPYKEISFQNIDRILQWIIGKVLIFYYNHNDIGDEIKVIQKIVEAFITTLKMCLLKYPRSSVTNSINARLRPYTTSYTTVYIPYTLRIRRRIRPFTYHIRSVYDRISPYYMVQYYGRISP